MSVQNWLMISSHFSKCFWNGNWGVVKRRQWVKLFRSLLHYKRQPCIEDLADMHLSKENIPAGVKQCLNVTKMKRYFTGIIKVLVATL